jgi:hypothetical protein
MRGAHRGAAGRASIISLVGVAALGLALVLALVRISAGLAAGPKQPIPFSHRVHAGDKRISCFFCHNTASYSENAGLPPVQKCLLCHNVIIPNFPPIQLLHAYYRGPQRLQWVRIYRLPDFVFFNHSVHINRQIDCGACHGDVKVMDRLEARQVFTMGFCVDCHRKYGATIDCYTCHR